MDTKSIKQMKKPQTHYYIYNDTRYENMKDCCVSLNLGRQEFRNLVKTQAIKKIIINDVKPKGDAIQKETEKTEL